MRSLYQEPDGPYYDTCLICPNGHTVNSASGRTPEHDAMFCGQCGARAISDCPTCSTPIRGRLQNAGIILSGWGPADYCHACGQPYPWTAARIAALAEAIDEADELSGDEKIKLKNSIPDIVVATPKTDTATARLKAGITKAGKVGGKLIYDVAIKVAADVVSKSLEGGLR